ncbi:MAG: hypothetical protein IJX86_00675 [Lachnospiraceae bacterium]|nr:hypothetical protein [Lachnospiraceae bacterium]
MYDIRNLNIWKVSSLDIFRCRDKVLEADVSKRKETIMSDKCQAVFDEILSLVPTANFAEIKRRRGGKLRFPIYINKSLMETDLDALELSVRSSNCLHRAGYRTVGELVEAIESSEDLKKIRNCGAKSIDEIMEQLFCYQYGLVDKGRKIVYINKVLELNRA